jgi:hypothetical protein
MWLMSSASMVIAELSRSQGLKRTTMVGIGVGPPVAVAFRSSSVMIRSLSAARFFSRSSVELRNKSPSLLRCSAVRHQRSFSERSGLDHFFRGPEPLQLALQSELSARYSPVCSKKSRQPVRRFFFKEKKDSDVVAPSSFNKISPVRSKQYPLPSSNSPCGGPVSVF